MTNDINALRKKAEDERKAKNYDKALLSFQNIWQNHKEARTKWDGWGYALCLNHFKKYDESIIVCKATYTMDKKFKYIKSQYAWAAYQVYIQKFDSVNGNINDLLKHANGIIKLTEDLNDDLARKETVFKIVDVLEEKGRWEEIVDWCSKIDVNVLSNEKYIHTLSNGKKISLPSPKEKWYSKKSKALEKLEKYPKCLKLTNEALLIYTSDIWFLRRKALCLGKLGAADEALRILKELSLKKPEWFIFKDIAEIYYEKSDFNNALNYCFESSFHAIKNPKQENLWELYFTISRILKKQDKIDLAKKYCLLSGILRLEHQWKIPIELKNFADGMGVKFDSNMKSSSLINELSKDWVLNKYSETDKQEGIIKNLLLKGNSGFIKSESGKDYFFRLKNFNDKKEYCVLNANVIFYTEKSFDKKKNQESEIAVNISLRGR